jgi:hypothetical protein
MIIYNPRSIPILRERLVLAGKILAKVQLKHCFITGSFLYGEKYKDIDVFVVTRSKKPVRAGLAIATIDFNDLHSLFYHSVSKSCVSKDILPAKPLKVTVTDYWSVINEAIPSVMNKKANYDKSIRFLVLYTEYFCTGQVLDTYELAQKTRGFKRPAQVLNYVCDKVPAVINSRLSKPYVRRFFYTQSGFYRNLSEYRAQDFLARLARLIARWQSQPNSERTCRQYFPARQNSWERTLMR